MNYQGIIIEESLGNKEVLNKLHILNTEVEEVTENHKTPWLKQWTMHTVEIPEDQADNIAQILSTSFDPSHPNWYADFKNNTFHYIIFKDKVFKIERAKPEQYQKVVEYGLTQGIPGYQLDFSPTIEEWKRENSNSQS